MSSSFHQTCLVDRPVKHKSQKPSLSFLLFNTPLLNDTLNPKYTFSHTLFCPFVDFFFFFFCFFVKRLGWFWDQIIIHFLGQLMNSFSTLTRSKSSLLLFSISLAKSHLRVFHSICMLPSLVFSSIEVFLIAAS